MKVNLYDKTGKKKGEIELPEIFEKRIRQDIALKYFEANKVIQPYSPDPEAGRKHSASGTISHKRHDWKGHYGRAISRAPRKTMWRRGTQFYWIGAEVSGARGGRKAHAPEGIGREKKINKKEMKIAINSGFAATADKKYVINRYGKLKDVRLEIPIIFESKLDNAKTKDMLFLLKSVFGEFYGLVLKKKKIRSGKGKSRGRRYKSNAGLLFVKSQDEKIKMKGMDVKNVKDIEISDLYPLGRLAVYTEKALKEINSLGVERQQ